MSITIDTDNYYASHLRRPRGRGLWAFEIGGELFHWNGPYPQARREAMRVAVARQARLIMVLP